MGHFRVTVTRSRQQYQLSCSVISCPHQTSFMCQWNTHRHGNLPLSFLPSSRVTRNGKHAIPIKNNTHLVKSSVYFKVNQQEPLQSYQSIQKEKTMYMFPFFNSFLSLFSSLCFHYQTQSHMTQGRVVQHGMECVSCLNTL